jgi:hypothetical protein
MNPTKVYPFVLSSGRTFKSKPFAPEVVAMFDEADGTLTRYQSCVAAASLTARTSASVTAV